MHPGGDKQTRRLPMHPQASSPRSVALPQLPSSSTLPIGVDIWYTVLLETPSLVQGTFTPQQSRPCRAYPCDARRAAIGVRVSNGTVTHRRRVIAVVHEDEAFRCAHRGDRPMQETAIREVRSAGRPTSH